MVDLTELYPSVFRMIRAEAKAFGKQIRFQKEVHIRICQKIQNAIESFIRNALKSSKGKLLPTHFQNQKVKDRTKIYQTRKNGKKYADLVEMIRQDKAVLALKKMERLTKAMVEFIQSKPYPIEKNVYLIVQNFVEEKIIDKTMKLIDLIESKNKRLIPNTLVLEIE